MDPTANLQEQIETANRIDDDGTWGLDEAKRLAELVIALNDWIKSGGFLPGPWARKDG